MYHNYNPIAIARFSFAVKKRDCISQEIKVKYVDARCKPKWVCTIH